MQVLQRCLGYWYSVGLCVCALLLPACVSDRGQTPVPSTSQESSEAPGKQATKVAHASALRTLWSLRI